MTAVERIAYFSDFWKQASNVFPYFDQRSIDFDQAYSDYLTRIMEAYDDREYCLLLSEFINLLGDGHTDFTFPKRTQEETGFLPFSLIHIQGEYYIQSIESDGEQHRWAKIISINGEKFADLLVRAFRYIYHVENYASPSKLHAILPFLLQPKGNLLETSVGIHRFDLAKDMHVPAEARSPNPEASCRVIGGGKLRMRLYEGNKLYVNLPNLLYGGAANEIAAAIKELSPFKGIILDLRENIGGMTAHGARIAELFLSGTFHGCQKRTRTMKGIDISSASQYARMSEEDIEKCITDGLCDREEVERCRKINQNALFEEYLDCFGGEGHLALYDGPCVILTSRNTISAAEDLLAMFRSNHRATIIGTPTHGSTGTPLLLPLSIGGGARICSVGYRLLDGTEFIGKGIAPDLHAENCIEDLHRGYDRVLSEALSLLN